MFVCFETAVARKTPAEVVYDLHQFYKYKNMPVDKFGRRETAVQENVSSDYRLHRSVITSSGEMDRIPPLGRLI